MMKVIPSVPPKAKHSNLENGAINQVNKIMVEVTHRSLFTLFGVRQYYDDADDAYQMSQTSDRERHFNKSR